MYLAPIINLFHTLKLGPHYKESTNFFNKSWVIDGTMIVEDYLGTSDGEARSPPLLATRPAPPVSVPSLSGLGHDALVNNSESILLHAEEPLSEGIADDVFGVCVPALVRPCSRYRGCVDGGLVPSSPSAQQSHSRVRGRVLVRDMRTFSTPPTGAGARARGGTRTGWSDSGHRAAPTYVQLFFSVEGGSFLACCWGERMKKGWIWVLSD